MSDSRYSRSSLLRPPIGELYYHCQHPDLSPSRNVKPFPDVLPNELLIQIVELAAGLSTSTVIALSMVSSNFRDIVDPVLFQDIHIGRKHESTRMLKTIISPECPPRLHRARNYILSIRLTRPEGRIGKDILLGLFNHCPNLTYLSPGIIHPSTWALTPPSRLQTLAFEAFQGIDWEKVDCTISPLAVQITRLFIENISSGNLRQLSRFHNLSHVFISYRTRVFYSYEQTPWDVLGSESPQLQLVLVHLKFLLPYKLAPGERGILKILEQARDFSPLFTRRMNVDLLDPRFVGVVSDRLRPKLEDRSENFIVFIPRDAQMHKWLDCGWTQGEKVVKLLIEDSYDTIPSSHFL
ncbi:hypothetical protein DL96DRAFT_1639351 [Flagelloscypha sp. PMI_526]|nr:hypothetical protein DL96DRAFT_1639351 [Flagelloscypha sp. PMI_526]